MMHYYVYQDSDPTTGIPLYIVQGQHASSAKALIIEGQLISKHGKTFA